MRKFAVALLCACLLAACKSVSPPLLPAPKPWDQRAVYLQHVAAWRLEGRAAAAMGKQGWQASLSWQQRGVSSEVHLAGPLGVGAVVLQRTPAGLSMNGGPPGDAVVAQLEDKLGFDLPLDDLEFWLLGVPNPGSPFDLTRNGQDRAQQLVQGGWTIDYDRYLPVAGDLLPAHLVLSRQDVKVKIIADQWDLTP